MGPLRGLEETKLERKEAALQILRILKPFSCTDRCHIKHEVESIYDIREIDTLIKEIKNENR